MFSLISPSYVTKEGKQELVWATSWGVSTRLMGGLIMTHSDDAGLVLPPKLAPIQVVFVPIYKNEEQFEAIAAKVAEISNELKAKGVSIKFDKRDTLRPGAKFAEWELKGVPLRIAIGARDLENGTLEIARRDTFEKQSIAQEDTVATVLSLLETIQDDLFKKASDYRKENTTEVDTFEEFKNVIENKGGFVSARKEEGGGWQTKHRDNASDLIGGDKNAYRNGRELIEKDSAGKFP